VFDGNIAESLFLFKLRMVFKNGQQGVENRSVSKAKTAS